HSCRERQRWVVGAGRGRTARRCSVIHIVGSLIRVGNLVRQRCGWCGLLLHDVDVRTVAVHPAPEDPEELRRALMGGFEPLTLLRVEGTNPVSFDRVEHKDGEHLPAGWCGDTGPL